MSISSSADYSNAPLLVNYPTTVLQSGLLTFVAGQTCTVPCAGIRADSIVSLTLATSTAGAAAYAAALTNHVFTVAITAGTGFTAVGADALYAGTVKYVVLSSNAPVVNVNSA